MIKNHWLKKIKEEKKTKANVFLSSITVQDSIVHYLRHYRGWAMQNFVFFQSSPQTFLWWFNPNWRSINFDFLWKYGIENRETKMKKKKRLNIGGM